MKKYLFPFLIIIISGLVFFMATKPLLDLVAKDKVDMDKKASAVQSLTSYKALFDIKNSDYGSVDPVDIKSLSTMPPDGIDNVKLIIDINQIAVKHNLNIKNIVIKTGDNATVGPDSRSYGLVAIDFSVSTSYKVFQDFLHDLETSLRLIDVASLSFSAGVQDQYDFNLEANAYWLKKKR